MLQTIRMVFLHFILCKNLKKMFFGPIFSGTGSRVSVLYDVINDFRLKECLKEKIGKSMERKECNAEGKRSACQKKQALFQLCFTKFPHKKYTYQM